MKTSVFSRRFWASDGDTIAAKLFGSGEHLTLTVVVLAHIAVAVPLAAFLNLWIDEAYTLETTGHGVTYAIERSLGFELQPPFYFVALTLWRLVDDSIFFARLFSILCTASTVVVSGALARCYLPGVPPALVAAVVALNPITIFAAVEARYYALALLLSALLLMYFHDGFMATQPSSAARQRHTATAVAALYTYYFLGFLLAAGGAALLLLRRKELRSYLFGMVVVAILFAPLALTIMRQVAEIGTTGLTRVQRIDEGARLVWQLMWRQLLPVEQDNILAIIRSWVSRLAVPTLLLIAIARRRWPPPKTVVSITLGVSVSLCFVGVAMRLGTDFFRPQHSTVLYIPILLAALAMVQFAGGAKATSVAAIASLVFCVSYVAVTYAPVAKLGDWIRVSNFIERHEKPSEPIVVFKAEFVLALGYHYAGQNSLIPIPSPTSRRRYDLLEQVLRNQDEIEQVISEHIGSARRFWLITSQTQPFRGVDFHPEILERFVQGHCKAMIDQVFVGSRVRLLEVLSNDATIDGGAQVSVPTASDEQMNSR